ncbi:MAG: hypothetical protein M1819_003109 [Sarea resinae]|nr:MAG: hypothetical protein M1819_003109 [Sarea resinae]
MPKPKQRLKEHKKKTKQKNQGPETADEFLEVGVQFEEAAEKWRAGDAAKSVRFFLRAIENYDTALKQFPDSFDMAYNKARVQYQITQYPKLAAQIPKPLDELLYIALESHKRALNLRQGNADTLFNTAQVLTSISEVILESQASSGDARPKALKLIEEAIEFFQRCFSLQEYQYSESQAQAKAVEAEFSRLVEFDNSQEGDSTMTDIAQEKGENSSETEQWASVVEPVTKDTLLDTAIAEVEALTTLCGLTVEYSGRGLAWVEELSTGLLQEKISEYVQGTGREEEVARAKGNLICAIGDAGYRLGKIDLQTYELQLESAFPKNIQIYNDAESLCAEADAHLTLNSTISEFSASQTGTHTSRLIASRWNHLTLALSSLTSASKLPTTENAKINIARGDTELLRFRLSEQPLQYDIAIKNAPTLLKNAQVYYRGAAVIAHNTGESDRVIEAEVKGAIAALLAGDTSDIQAVLRQRKDVVGPILVDMAEDGLLGMDQLADVESLANAP